MLVKGLHAAQVILHNSFFNKRCFVFIFDVVTNKRSGDENLER